VSIGIGDWRGLSRGGELRSPDFPAGLFVEGAEASVVRGPDEDESARRDDGSSQAGAPGIPLACGQVVGDP